MSDMNTIMIEGRLTRDPEFKMVGENNSQLCKFTIANNMNYIKNNNTIKNTYFFNIVAWGELANNCNNSFKKGNKVTIVGSLRVDKWTDKDGKTRYNQYILANTVGGNSTNNKN